jgi:hypothetical protein
MKNTELYPKLIKLCDYIYYGDASILEMSFIEKYKDNGWVTLNKNKGGSLGCSNLLYTKEKCGEIIKGCVYRSDLYVKYGRVISLCKVNNWFVDEIEKLIRKKRSNGYWTKERCREESICYYNIKDFINKRSSAYRSSLKNGWLEELTSHMYTSKKGKGYWTKERCREESNKYKKRYSFQKGSRGAYKASYKGKWLDEFFTKQ